MWCGWIDGWYVGEGGVGLGKGMKPKLYRQSKRTGPEAATHAKEARSARSSGVESDQLRVEGSI